VKTATFLIGILASLPTAAQTPDDEKAGQTPKNPAILADLFANRAASVTGDLNGAPQYSRRCCISSVDPNCRAPNSFGDPSPATAYMTIKVHTANPAGENLVAAINPAGTDISDTTMTLYCHPFNPADSDENVVAYDDDGGSGLLSAFDGTEGAYMRPFETYDIVVSLFSQASIGGGNFLLDLGGAIQLGPPCLIDAFRYDAAGGAVILEGQCPAGVDVYVERPDGSTQSLATGVVVDGVATLPVPFFPDSVYFCMDPNGTLTDCRTSRTVPALSHWALAAFLVLLAAAGLYLMRKRRPALRLPSTPFSRFNPPHRKPTQRSDGMRKHFLILGCLLTLPLAAQTAADEKAGQPARDPAALADLFANRADSVAGSLNGAPVYDRIFTNSVDPNCNAPSMISGIGAGVPYVVYEVFSTTGENLVGAINPAGTDVSDTTLSLYCAPFNPADPMANLVAYNDDFGSLLSGFDGTEGAFMQAGASYFLVVSLFSPASIGGGNFQLDLGGNLQIGSPCVVNALGFGPFTSTTVQIEIEGACSSFDLYQEFRNGATELLLEDLSLPATGLTVTVPFIPNQTIAYFTTPPNDPQTILIYVPLVGLVPTLQTWALGAFLVLLAATALYFMQKRRPA